MTVRIIVRVDDPAFTAEILGALGIDTEAPNRPNPEAWTTTTTVTLVVAAAGGRRPGVYLGLDDFDGALDAAAEIAGSDAVTIRRDGAAGSVDICEDLSILVERHAPVARSHDTWDNAQLHTVMPMFERHARLIRHRLARAGATNPRLVGNRLGRMAGPSRWLLVVDASEDADLGMIQALLTEIGERWASVEVRRASTFDPGHLAEIDNLAFDI